LLAKSWLFVKAKTSFLVPEAPRDPDLHHSIKSVYPDEALDCLWSLQTLLLTLAFNPRDPYCRGYTKVITAVKKLVISRKLRQTFPTPVGSTRLGNTNTVFRHQQCLGNNMYDKLCQHQQAVMMMTLEPWLPRLLNLLPVHNPVQHSTLLLILQQSATTTNTSTHLEWEPGDRGSNPGSRHYSIGSNLGQVVYTHCLPSFSAPRNWGTKGRFRHLSGYGD